MNRFTVFTAAALLLGGCATLSAQAAPAAQPAQQSSRQAVTVAALPTPPAEDPALKADPATLDDMRKLFDVMQMHKLFDLTMKTFVEQTRTQLAADLKKANPKITDEETQKGVDAGAASMKGAVDSLNFDMLLEKEFLPQAQSLFTHTQLQQVIAFYQTPAGEKFRDLAGLLLSRQRWNQALGKFAGETAMKAQEEARKVARKTVGLPETEPEPTVNKPAATHKPPTVIRVDPSASKPEAKPAATNK